MSTYRSIWLIVVEASPLHSPPKTCNWPIYISDSEHRVKPEVQRARNRPDRNVKAVAAQYASVMIDRSGCCDSETYENPRDYREKSSAFSMQPKRLRDISDQSVNPLSNPNPSDDNLG